MIRAIVALTGPACVATLLAAQTPVDRRHAPAVELLVGYQRDSDGFRAPRYGIHFDGPLGPSARLGVLLQRSRIGDGTRSFPEDAVFGMLSMRPHTTTRMDLRAGVMRQDPGSFGETWATPAGELRVRYAAPRAGPRFDFRFQRLMLGTTPALVLNQAVRTEGRGILEVPAGPIRLRGGGRYGKIDALGLPNTRWGIDAGVVRRLPPGVELSVQYHRLSYDLPSTVGYFAPQRVETAELGSYAEFGEDGPVVLVLDLGAGLQRLAEHGVPVGPWKLALRGYVWMAVPFASGRQVRLEVEAYDAPFAPEGAVSTPSWRFLSTGLSLRWAF